MYMWIDLLREKIMPVVHMYVHIVYVRIEARLE